MPVTGHPPPGRQTLWLMSKFRVTRRPDPARAPIDLDPAGADLSRGLKCQRGSFPR